MYLSTKILSSNGPTMFSLGQAGYVFKSSRGTIIGLDMYLSQCVERVEGHMGFKRLLPVLLQPNEIVFDYIIASHEHFDHFDMDAIPTLMANHYTKLFASVECEKEVKRLMMTNENITYVKVGDKVTANDVEIKFEFCDHGKGTPDAVAVVIEMDGFRIFYAGDTCLRKDKINLKDIDVMIAPINGAFGNLSERECVELAKHTKARLTIPCHYGMFASHGGNPGLFKLYADEANIHYLLMAQGEELKLNK